MNGHASSVGEAAESKGFSDPRVAEAVGSERHGHVDHAEILRFVHQVDSVGSQALSIRDAADPFAAKALDGKGALCLAPDQSS